MKADAGRNYQWRCDRRNVSNIKYCTNSLYTTTNILWDSLNKYYVFTTCYNEDNVHQHISVFLPWYESILMIFENKYVICTSFVYLLFSYPMFV